MKRLRWQLLIIFLTGLVIGVLLITEQPGKLSSVVQPQQGGVYTEALTGSLERLNPVLDFYNQPDKDVDSLIYSGLLKFDDRGLPVGDLAQSWGVSQDGTIYNVVLRSDARWQDGQPVTALDVTFTIDLLRNGGTIVPADLQAFWQKVKVTALSPTAMQFILPEAYAPFLDYLTFGVLPKHLLDGKKIDDLVNDSFNLAPVGSGPYQFDHLIIENGQIAGVSLKASTYNSTGGKGPYISQIVFRYYPDAAAAFAAYQQGEVQGIGNVTSDILPDVLKTSDLSIYTARQPEITMVLFNLNNSDVSFFQNKDVRRALLMGLDRQAIIDHLLQGQAIIADGPILPGTWAYYDGLQSVTYDPDAARALLVTAGYSLSQDGTVRTNKDGLALHFSLTYPDDDLHKALAEKIQSYWQALNVTVDLEALPYDQLISDRLAAHNYQAALVDLNLSNSPDPDPYPFWDEAQITGGQNYSQWDNRLASEYLEEARTTTDLDTRIRMYDNFQVVFSQELPALPLYYPVYTYAVDQQVNGVSTGPLYDPSDRFSSVASWYLIARQSSTTETTPSK
jgi:peptide/nickel transport system substrate-binding protein